MVECKPHNIVPAWHDLSGCSHGSFDRRCADVELTRVQPYDGSCVPHVEVDFHIAGIVGLFGIERKVQLIPGGNRV